MRLEKYNLKEDANKIAFEFISEGPKGDILKGVFYSKIKIKGIKNFYNLAFGDMNSSTRQLDDKVVTDNGDSEKVLATVVAAVYAFAGQYPEAWIYATGSTATRTRLYRMGINKYFDIAQDDFEIMGQFQNEWEWYEKGKNYQAFAVQRKKQ